MKIRRKERKEEKRKEERRRREQRRAEQGKEGEGKKCMVQLSTGHVILLTAQLVLRKTSTQHL